MSKPTEMIFCGADDGHDSVKLAVCVLTEEEGTPTAKHLSYLTMPSKVANGVRSTSITGDDAGGIYRVGDSKYTVSDSIATNEVIDTRSIEYPTSDINRVLVTDALIRANLRGKEISLVTGLPVADFFASGLPNRELIDRKKANLLTSGMPKEKAVHTFPTESLMPQITSHQVASEGIAAIYDFAINDDGSDNAEFLDLLDQAPVGVIDIGGKTIDMAVATIGRGKPQIDLDRTQSLQFGMLRVSEEIARQLRIDYDVRDLTPRAMHRVIAKKELLLAGQSIDVSASVIKALDAVRADFLGKLKAKWGDARDLARIIVVGGGAYLLKDVVNELYKHTVTREAPEMANARGMLKIGMRQYLMSKATAQV